MRSPSRGHHTLGVMSWKPLSLCRKEHYRWQPIQQDRLQLEQHLPALQNTPNHVPDDKQLLALLVLTRLKGIPWVSAECPLQWVWPTHHAQCYRGCEGKQGRVPASRTDQQEECDGPYPRAPPRPLPLFPHYTLLRPPKLTWAPPLWPNVHCVSPSPIIADLLPGARTAGR